MTLAISAFHQPGYPNTSIPAKNHSFLVAVCSFGCEKLGLGQLCRVSFTASHHQLEWRELGLTLESFALFWRVCLPSIFLSPEGRPGVQNGFCPHRDLLGFPFVNSSTLERLMMRTRCHPSSPGQLVAESYCWKDVGSEFENRQDL